MNDNFFWHPTQVAFFDKFYMRYVGGIARFNEIIDFRDGEIINIEEYLDKMKKDFPNITYPIIPLSWVNLSNECIGDAMFNSSTGEIILD